MPADPTPPKSSRRRWTGRNSSLSGFCMRACFPWMAPATCANDGPLETVANRSVPLACGPNVDQARPARGGSDVPPGGPCLARETPAGCPRQASPARTIALLGGALAGSGPGTSLYRRAVPGHRHGGTPASCWFKPCPRRWLAWAASPESADAGNPPVEYQPSVIGRRLKLHFALEVQRSGQGLCPTLLRLPGPWRSTCRALASHASQPVATGWPPGSGQACASTLPT